MRPPRQSRAHWASASRGLFVAGRPVAKRRNLDALNFRSDGPLVSDVDRNGNAITFAYPAAGGYPTTIAGQRWRPAGNTVSAGGSAIWCALRLTLRRCSGADNESRLGRISVFRARRLAEVQRPRSTESAMRERSRSRGRRGRTG